MANVPTDAALNDFYSKHGDAPGSEALAELGFTLQELSEGSYGFVPREIEAIEAAWLWPEMGWSLARFVMRLAGGRRVLVVSDVGPSEAAEEASRGKPTVETIEELLADVDELDVAVDLVIEDMPPHVARPEVDERLPGEWLEEVEVLDKLAALWREGGGAVVH